MATITSTLRLNDSMSRTFRTITTAMSSTLTAMRSIQGIDLGAEFAQAAADVRLAERAISSLDDEMSKFSKDAQSATKSASDGFTVLKGIAVQVIMEIARAGKEVVKSFVNFGNEAINARARLDMINDGLRTTDKLNQKIFESAQRARSGYEDVRTAVSQIGMATDGLFQNNEQLIAFTELLNKQFMISGTRGQQAASVMYNISQAMNQGVLRGQDLNSILQNTPQIARNIEKYLGAATGTIKELGEAGKITSDVLVNSMFSAANQINQQFGDMQDNFEDVSIVMIDKFKFAMEGMATSFNIWLSGVFAQGIAWIIDHIDILSTALATVGSIAVIVGTVMAISWAIAHLPILLIIAAIGLLVGMFGEFGITATDILGFVGGLFGWLYGVIYNVIAELYNALASFAEFFANFLNDPVGSIYRLFYKLADFVLGILQTIASGIDAVFGSNLADAVSGWRGGLSATVESVFGKPAVEYARMEQKSVSDTMKFGADFGKSIGAGMADFTDTLKGLGAGIGEGDVLSDLLSNVTTGAGGGKALKTAEQNKLITDEDLKMLADIAAYDVRLQYQQLTPEISMTFGDIRETADVDGVIERFVSTLQEQASSRLAVVG